LRLLQVAFELDLRRPIETAGIIGMLPESYHREYPHYQDVALA
jgi:hypothetical protein